MNYLDRLAAFVAATRFDALPMSTVAAAKLVLLDTLGAIVAGSAMPENGELARLAAGRSPSGGATLLGHRGKADAFWAALTNATAGVALEVDEGSRLGGGHPAIHVVPGALAVAEERRLDGRRLLESVVAGYEVGSRIGGATTVRPNVHSHGTWGTISTAVAVAKLGGAPGATVRAAMNLAASMSPANTWTPALDGATIRNLYPGRSAFQGILAVELERCGFTGLGDAPSDVYGTILAERFEPGARRRRDRGAPRAPGHTGSSRTTSSCTRVADSITSRSTRSWRSGRLSPLGQRHRESGDRHDSLRGADGRAGARQLARRPVLDPVGRRGGARPRANRSVGLRLARRSPTSASARSRSESRSVRAPTMTPRRADAPTAHVRLVLRGGKSFERTTSVVRGDALSPVPRDEITAKFVSLAGPVLGDAGARKIIDVVEEIDSLDDVGSLTAMLAP